MTPGPTQDALPSSAASPGSGPPRVGRGGRVARLRAAVARHLYHGAQRLRGEPVARVLRELEASQRWPERRLLDLQWERQVRLARHAYATVPFYRARWGAVGLTPDSLRSPADWGRLPILEKRDVQRSSRELLSSRAPRGLAASTSGSSGTPVTVLRSHRSWAHAHANVFRAWRWHGLDLGDRHAYFWGVPLDRPGRRRARLRDWFFNRDRCSAFDLSAAAAGRFYRRQLARPGRFATGYPSALAHFAHELRALGLDGRALAWEAVITTAETLHPHQHGVIGEVFGCPVVDSYGCAEVGVAGVECAHGRMHVPVESVVVEIVPAEDGEAEILLTDLHNYSQPIIRYRVGDLARTDAAGGTDCPCGRGLPVFPGAAGRAGDTLDLGGGRRVNANLPSYVFKHHARDGTVREYQFVQYAGGSVELRIVAGPAWSEAVRSALGEEVRSVLGVAVPIRVVPEIERRGRGKHRDFVRVEDAAPTAPGC